MGEQNRHHSFGHWSIMTKNGKAVPGGNVTMTSLLTLDRAETQAVSFSRCAERGYALTTFTMYCVHGASAGVGNRIRVWPTVAILLRVAELAATAASGPTPTAHVVVESQNVSTSLGYQCSSQNGLNSLIQQGSLRRNIPGLNLSLPVNLSNPLAVDQIAQVLMPVRIRVFHAL